MDAVEVAFQTYAQLSRVRVKSAVAMSAFHNMHIDICNAACSNRVNFLLLSFHMRQRYDGSFETVNSGLKEVNANVLKDPPCSVGLLVDNGLGSPPTVNCSQHIYVLFFGGSDDREALMLARRMLQHGGVKLTVIQFVVQRNIRNMIPSRVSMSSHLQTQPVIIANGLKWLAREVVAFFKAPWMKTQKCVRPEQDGQVTEVHIVMDDLSLESERLLDMQALAPILEAAKQAKKVLEVGSQAGDESNRNLTVRVIETQNLEESVLDVVSSAQPSGLIITALHNSSVTQSDAFAAVEDHGLGPLGDFLVSKKHFHMHASLLVVKQHTQVASST